MEKNILKNNVYMCITESLSCTAEEINFNRLNWSTTNGFIFSSNWELHTVPPSHWDVSDFYSQSIPKHFSLLCLLKY